MTPHPLRCEHYDVCWFQHQHHKCINDNPKDIPCIFDTRKGVDFTVYIGRGDIALTEIEIALRKEESPSDNVQWAIERINRLQEEWDASHTLAASEREQVLKLLDDLNVAFCEYGMDVMDPEFPAPPSHRTLMQRMDEMRAELRKQEAPR